LHKLVFQENVLEDGVAVRYFVHREVASMMTFFLHTFFSPLTFLNMFFMYWQKLLNGEININKSGILCGCCNEVVIFFSYYVVYVVWSISFE